MKSEIFKTPLPYLALLFAHIIWGGNYVVAKITLTEFPVMTLAFLRFGMACLLIAPFLITVESKKRRIKLEHLPRIFVAALFMAGINIAFFYQGIIRTTAIDASVLDLSIPIISVLAGWWLLKEKVFAINLVGILLGFLGAVIVIGLPLIFLGNFSTMTLFGDLLILLSAVSFVAGSLMFKKMLSTYPPLVITAMTFLFAALIFLVPAIFEYFLNPNWVSKVSILGIMGLIYITILSSISAYFLLLWGLSKVELTRANLFQYLEPAVAATLAVPLLGERISFSFIIGTVLVALGVYWGTLGKLHHHHAHHKSHRN